MFDLDIILICVTWRWLVRHCLFLYFKDESVELECTDKDLLYISSTVQVHVCNVVYELLGEISSDDESDTELE